LLRDKDIVNEVIGSNRIGFIGSDTYDELTRDRQRSISFSEVATTGLRFALEVRNESVDSVREKIVAGETLDIVTSYPKSARRCAGAVGTSLRVIATLGGSVEAAPALYADADGIVDLVDSGETACQNGLEIIVDNLLPVSIGAVWGNKGIELEGAADFNGVNLVDAIVSIERRVLEAQAGQLESSTQRLASDVNKLVKKLGEESAEAIAAFLTGNSDELEGETADVMYVLAIANALRGTSLRSALGTLAARNLC
jgi:phosphoribosyl-ATP pyrophosphohydrolase